ncbi:hypothetical protein FGG08_005745 [Glutinoglossum americanum]|uniref:Uncharacterized protein n=1 Tax=Glutinoglossum americanum TaxID=1670608 RepID=A0A9P8I2F3_9PEZI|nr:hypothetical protein FGG08_005745 [Glutinoglossum americanum]
MPRGRPQKYTTDAERLAAKRVKDQRYKQKKKSVGLTNLPDLLPDIASHTLVSVGVRAKKLDIPADIEDDYLSLQEDDAPAVPIPALSDISLSLYIQDSYPAPSIPRISSTPTSTTFVILRSTPEPAPPKPSTAGVEVVDLAGSASSSDSEDSQTGLEHTEQEVSEYQEIAPEGSVRLEEFVKPMDEEATGGKTVPDILGNAGLMKPNSHATTAESWERLFTGYVSKDEASSPPVVSLLQAKQSFDMLERSPKTQWDLDSILAFPRSLAFARRGITYLPNPLITANISTNVHLTLSVPDLSNLDYPKYIRQPLNKVPHYCLGNINGFPELNIFLFFPQLYDPEYDFIRLTDEVLQRWTDKVLLPAVYEHLPSGSTQHLPACWKQGQLASLAARGEKGQRKTSTMSRQQALCYTLHAELSGFLGQRSWRKWTAQHKT